MKRTLVLAVVTSALLAACGGGGSGGNPLPAADTTVPSVTLSASQTGTSTTVNLTVTASDNVGVTKVEFYRGSSLIGSDTSAPYTFTDTVTRADVGTVAYSARASDAAGNVGNAAQQLNVNIVTLYQGVWGWAVAAQDQTVLDSGAVVFSDESVVQGLTTAFGGFSNKAQTRQGAALLGPISAAGHLDTGFVLSDQAGTVLNPYFVGSDDDNILGTYQGSPIFEGSGATFVGTALDQLVYVVMIQASATVPQGAALTSAKSQAQADAVKIAGQFTSNASRLKTDVNKLKTLSAKVLQGR